MNKLFNKKIFVGEIMDIRDKNTMTGKFLVEFRARTEEGKMYVCTIWEKDAERFFKEIKVGDKIHLEGVEKNENELSIKYFRGKEAKGGVKISGPTPESIAEYREKRRAAGFEFIKIPVDDEFMTISKPRQHCVLVNGNWEGKMEYCLRIHGAKFVTDAFRDFGDPQNAGSLARNTNPISFKRILEELVDLAADQTGHLVERVREDVKALPIPPVDAKPIVMEENDIDFI
jgi:hypothetical protein